MYFEIRCGCYGLPQSVILANKQLRLRLEKEGYYESRTTPGLWRQKWRPIQFCLIVDDFGVEYVGKQHADHLPTIPKNYHNITEDLEGKKYAGIDLKWDYKKRTCRATMDGYILELRNKYGHMTPKKPQYSPHKHHPIDYGATQQLLQPTDTIPPLNEKCIKIIQGIVGALLYVGRAVKNKLLVALIEIGAQQSAATKETEAEIEQQLYYADTYPNDGILFRKSDMILAAHADAGFLNKSRARSRAGAHMLLS